MNAKIDKQKSAKSSPATNKNYQGFDAGERAAMKQRMKELKAEESKAEAESSVLAAIDELQEPDRGMAKRLHTILKASLPGPLIETLVRDAGVCQGRQDHLLFPTRTEVQNEVRHARLQRHGQARRGRPVAGGLRAEGVDCQRRGPDHRAGEESAGLNPGPYPASPICPKYGKMGEVAGCPAYFAGHHLCPARV